MAERYVHALRFRVLNRIYDPTVHLLTRDRHCKRLIVEQAAAVDGERIMDLGCGTGNLTIKLKRTCPGAEVHGVDGDADMIARVGRKSHALGVDLNLHHSDARRVPFGDGSFDCVVSSLFFHHLAPDAKHVVLKEVARVLKPGGRLVIADWGRAADPLQWLLSWSVRFLDGPAVTRENFTGQVPGVIERSGFDTPVEKAMVRTPVGTLRILRSQLRAHLLAQPPDQ